ncbi:metallophosphatase domain-containing protein [Holophaga foetida]|uniref:metallophosphatase domain-containing protein n=1 Tax=Holophaga foetida TaxID=35839 RepID=UPI00024742A8|nr:metallophosphatase domain-containing protein [Holophaga foetida]
MRLVCLSDTHGEQDHFKIPDGDILIHAGDFCSMGSEREVLKVAQWLTRLPHRWKIVVAGNHDRLFEQQPEVARAMMGPGILYLQDSGCEIEGLRFWGSPWQPWFQSWAFNLPRKGAKLREKWNLIPIDTDALITHGPPHGILDSVRPRMTAWGPSEEGSGPLGCEELAIRLATVRPRLHVFGHIHDGYGFAEKDSTTYVNASVCNEDYQPVNPIWIVDLEPGGKAEVYATPPGKRHPRKAAKVDPDE